MRTLILVLVLTLTNIYSYTIGTGEQVSNQAISNIARAGGDLSAPTIRKLMEGFIGVPTMSSPMAGGTLTIDDKPLGSWDLVVKPASIISSGWTATDWFTTTADSRSALVVVNGDLTIDAGQTFIPPARKLFTVVYVRGTLTVNGTLSMTARGANHSATGSNITARDIKLAIGTYSGITDPTIPAEGGAGAPSTTGGGSGSGGVSSFPGASGGVLQTGGGGRGAGAYRGAGTKTLTIGSGGTGTAFSGGAGSGSVHASTDAASPNAGIDGGTGGAAVVTISPTFYAGGGAGNPGGAKGYPGDAANGDGDSGTGGTLIVICDRLAGSGGLKSQGSNGGAATASNYPASGAGSGGGVVAVICRQNISTVSTNVQGGLPGAISYAGIEALYGGSGGSGSAQILIIP